METILVIEDDEQIRTEVMEWLQFEGYEVVGAANGLQGLERAAQHRPDLILCDIIMPEMDGHRVLLEVRSDPDLNRIPFIYLTARADRESMRNGMNLGADDYITKPFTLDEVMGAINSRFERQAASANKMQKELDYMEAELDEMREKNLLTSQLTAMYSHDFRTPLAAILSSIELMRTYEDRLSPERRRTHLDRMAGSVNQLLQMLDDMLLSLQIDSGYLKYDPQPLDVTGLIETVVEELALANNETHNVRFSSAIKRHLQTDPILLRRIATNLLSNAMKYSPSGSEIDVTLVEDEGGIELVVQDQGLGIPENEIPHLFEPFRRISSTKSIKGTGLGLFIVRQATEACGGSIEVESTIGEGTRFIVRFPAVR
jgi:two-component system sensor histidine kinase/response regulator